MTMTVDLVILVLTIPYAYILARAVTTAYFHVKFDYHKRFLKSMEGMD